VLVLIVAAYELVVLNQGDPLRAELGRRSCELSVCMRVPPRISRSGTAS
jgi:hypothetical protein